MKGVIENGICLVVVLFLGCYSEVAVSFYKSILLDRYISLLLIVLFSVVFGLVMVITLFAMWLFSGYEARKNSFLDKLMDDEKFDFYIKPMFERFIRSLYVMLLALVYFVVLSIVQNIAFEEFASSEIVVVGVSVLFYVYLYLVVRFFLVVKNIIRNLETIGFIFENGMKND